MNMQQLNNKFIIQDKVKKIFSDVRKINEVMNRKGMKEFIDFLENSTYLENPASTKYHGAYAGGLAEHSLNVFFAFNDMLDSLNISLDKSTIFIVSFGHDLCKLGAYNGNSKPYTYNSLHKKGHAKLSIEIIEQFIKLDEQEKEIILYHMGVYRTNEFSNYANEYTLKEMTDVFNKNKIAKLFHFADDITAQFIDG